MERSTDTQGIASTPFEGGRQRSSVRRQRTDSTSSEGGGIGRRRMTESTSSEGGGGPYGPRKRTDSTSSESRRMSNVLGLGNGVTVLKESILSFIDGVQDKVKGKANRKVKARRRTKSLSKDHEEFYSVFNKEETRRRLTVLHDCPNDEMKKDINFKLLPPLDDYQTVHFTAKELVGRVVKSQVFRFTIMFLIFLNFILIAIETDKSLSRQYHAVFEGLDQFITTVFLCEVLLKWFHGFRKFWYNGFNILDFFIVFGLIIGPMLLSSNSNKIIRILRVLRVFRSLREINSIPRLQVIVQAILQSVPDMANIVVLLVIFMLVFSVLGITLFSDDIKSFKDLSTTMFSLFICITQDGWVDILTEFKAADSTTYAGGSIYLIVFIVMGAFIFTNLIVAVVVTNLEYAVKDVKMEESQQAKELERLHIESEQGEHVVKTNVVDEIPNRVFEEQNPLIIPDLSGLDIRCVENYFLIVSAMEENLHVYQQLVKELRDILNELCELNKSAAEEGVVDKGIKTEKSLADVQSLISNNQSMSKMWRERADGGGADMLSSLMKMEHRAMTDSSKRNSIADVVSEVASTNMKNTLSSMDEDVRNRYFRRRVSSVSAAMNQELKYEKKKKTNVNQVTPNTFRRRSSLSARRSSVEK